MKQWIFKLLGKWANCNTMESLPLWCHKKGKNSPYGAVMTQKFWTIILETGWNSRGGIFENLWIVRLFPFAFVLALGKPWFGWNWPYKSKIINCGDKLIWNPIIIHQTTKGKLKTGLLYILLSSLTSLMRSTGLVLQPRGYVNTGSHILFHSIKKQPQVMRDGIGDM